MCSSCLQRLGFTVGHWDTGLCRREGEGDSATVESVVPVFQCNLACEAPEWRKRRQKNGGVGISEKAVSGGRRGGGTGWGDE